MGKKSGKFCSKLLTVFTSGKLRLGKGVGQAFTFYLLIKMLSTFLWYSISFNKHKDFQANFLLKYSTHTEKYTIVNTQLGGFSHREHTYGASISVSELVTTQLNC